MTASLKCRFQALLRPAATRGHSVCVQRRTRLTSAAARFKLHCLVSAARLHKPPAKAAASFCSYKPAISGIGWCIHMQGFLRAYESFLRAGCLEMAPEDAVHTLRFQEQPRKAGPLLHTQCIWQISLGLSEAYRSRTLAAEAEVVEVLGWPNMGRERIDGL